MASNSIPANGELAVAGQKPSYFIGAVAGATTGAVALNLYVGINPLLLGSAAQIASAYITGDMSDIQSLLITGAGVGAIAGVIRTAVDRRWGTQKDTSAKVAIDTATGLVAAPMATIGKCMIFPVFSDFWKGNLIAQTLTCSAVGGFSATVMAPISIAASTAARLANQYFAKA